MEYNTESFTWCAFLSASRVALAEWFSRFYKETLAFQVLLAKRAVEALWVIVVVEGLHPAVPRLYWEATRDAFCCEQLVPVLFAVGKSILKVERTVGKDLVAVGAGKAFGMKVCPHRFQAVLSFHFAVTPLPSPPARVHKCTFGCSPGSPGDT